MQLPLVEEVRDARRLADESQTANLQLTRVNAALTGLALLEHRAARDPRFDVPLPGEELVRELAESWPALADLEAIGPRPTQDFRVRLYNRQTQLRSAEALLRPISHDSTRRAQVLHELQHRQRHMLEDPRWSEPVAELAAIGAEREQVSQRLQPLKQKLLLVDPAKGVVDGFLERIDGELAVVASSHDSTGLEAWRTASVANGVIDSLTLVLAHLALEIPIPRSIELPSRPDPARGDQFIEEVERVRHALADLRDALHARYEALEERTLGLDARYQELTRIVLERMG